MFDIYRIIMLVFMNRLGDETSIVTDAPQKFYNKIQEVLKSCNAASDDTGYFTKLIDFLFSIPFDRGLDYHTRKYNEQVIQSLYDILLTVSPIHKLSQHDQVLVYHDSELHGGYISNKYTNFGEVEVSVQGQKIKVLPIQLVGIPE